MRSKLVRQGDKIKNILVGKTKDENSIITEINEILFELMNPKIRKHPYKDIRKTRKHFEHTQNHKIYVSLRNISGKYIKKAVKVKTSDLRLQKRVESIYSRYTKYSDFLENLSADLNTYFMTINSFSMSANLLYKQNLKDLKKDRIWLRKSFFERWDEYKPLKKFITMRKTSSLYENLRLHNKQRKLLIELISEIIKTKNL